ncbi:MAG: BlaI/MecI/CopY family transcriptional regulator [Parachlamydiaceae bacterium]|nr:BlaI/MecI/CopY family transcriptional regulator [Parachlamydiaceae bacterium]
MTKRGFGELELAILNILKSGERITVKQVHKIIGEQDKYNTIMTVMHRLAQKKVLSRERIGLQYEYWLVSSKEKAPTFIEQFKKKIFGIKTTEMFSYLIESAEDITDDELEEMEKILQKAKNKKKAGE